MCFSIVFAVAAPSPVEAAKPRSGTYKSPKSTYQQPAPKTGDGISKTQPGTDAGTKAPGTTTTSPSRGFFGGGFAKGLFIGGLAGMLFGGMFGNMGFLGNILGLMVNVLAIVFLFMIIRSIVSYFVNRRKYDRKRY